MAMLEYRCSLYPCLQRLPSRGSTDMSRSLSDPWGSAVGRVGYCFVDVPRRIAIATPTIQTSTTVSPVR